MPTQTIAGFLRSDPIKIVDGGSKHIVVIDEASMVDIPTMYQLVVHADPGVFFLFTGDPNQLPPIGPGKVLSDLIESSSIAKTELDIVKRQDESSGIPEYSRFINSGIAPIKLSAGSVYFYETAENSIADRCVELFSEQNKGSLVVAPTRSLVDDINKKIQGALNPLGNRMQFLMSGEEYYIDFRQGDSVLFTENHYDRNIQNGTLGVLISVEQIDYNYGSVRLDTGEIVAIDSSLVDCLRLGYCITLHKAQGSQFPRIIVALKKSQVVDRAWLYTAVTRAEAEVHIVGEASLFKGVVDSQSRASARRSHLKDLLQGR